MKTINYNFIGVIGFISLLLLGVNPSYAKEGADDAMVTSSSSSGSSYDDNGKADDNMSSTGSENKLHRKELKKSDEERVLRAIDKVETHNRLQFLTNLLVKLENLYGNISNSNMIQARKERYFNLINEIKEVVQNKYSEVWNAANPDSTAPLFSNLTITKLMSTGATISFSSNESGTGYYVALAGSGTPNALQIKSGVDSVGVTVPLKGSFHVTSGTNSFNLTGLSPGSTYYVYFTQIDTRGNLQQNIGTVIVATYQN